MEVPYVSPGIVPRDSPFRYLFVVVIVVVVVVIVVCVRGGTLHQAGSLNVDQRISSAL